MKKIILYLLSFITPIIFLLIMAYICNYLPFGSFTFNAFDAYNQYPSFFIELSNILNSGHTLLYTLHGALGVNFYNIITSYLGSPLNILIFFFKENQIYLLFTLLVYLKIGFCGLTMYIYLNSLNTKYKDTYWNLIFALIYSFSGAVIAYDFHIMWLDAFILLPIIIKYLDKLILEQRGFKYTIFLGLAIMINYYMGLILCIFCLLYFIYKSLITNNFNFKTITRFIIYSLFSGLISMIVLLPTIISLSGGRISLNTSNLLNIQDFSLYTIPYNYTIGSFIYNDNGNFGSPQIFCTIFSLVLVILYFFNQNETKKNKIITGIFILFFNISFFFNLFDYGWSLFQIPVWWFHRYTFVYIFFLITIAYKTFTEINQITIKKRSKIIIFLIFTILTILSFIYKTKGQNLADYYVLYLFISIILFYIYLKYLKESKLFIILIILELGLNTYTILNTNNGLSYTRIKENYQENNDIIQSIPDKEEYRIMFIKDISNPGLIYNYNSPDLFSSSYNLNTAKFFKSMGIEKYSLNHQEISINNPAVLSLLGVKYFIGTSNYFVCNEGYCQNDLAMPLVYEVNPKLNDVKLKSSNYIENINNIYSALLYREIELMTKIPEDYITKENVYIDDSGYIYTQNKTGYLLLEYKAQKDVLILADTSLKYTNNSHTNNKIYTTINDETYKVASDSDCLIPLKKGDVLKMQITFEADYESSTRLKSLYFGVLDLQEYENAINTLNETTNFNLISDNQSILKGSITVENNPVMLTIPYDKGITIYVDGKKTTYYKVLDTFIGLDITPGSHEIKVTYFPVGLKAGIIISSISLTILVILEILKNKKQKDRIKQTKLV